jgi:hypothetical protein
MANDNRVVFDPEYERLHQFDAENNLQPSRAVAKDIAAKYGIDEMHPIVDDIAHAVEDALDLGQRRADYLPRRSVRMPWSRQEAEAMNLISENYLKSTA